MRKANFYLFVIILLFSCNKNEDGTNTSGIISLSDINIDIDGDNNYDYVVTINHMTTNADEEGISESVISIVPLRNNELLYTQGRGYLPLSIGDSIPFNDSDSLKWFGFSADLLSYSYSSNGGEWEGNWYNTGNKFLPVKLEKDDKFYTGWIKMRFETGTTSCNCIITDKFINTVSGESMIIE